MKYVEAVKADIRDDVTWNRVARLTAAGAKALPSASAQYLADKLPIIGWLPRYNPRWVLSDFIAGLTIGLMLIPQGLSYAKIADIPVEYGLMSSWFPSAIYAFMGTSKDLSPGPTSLTGLLTSENVAALKDRWTPSEIASATAFMMGIYGMALGFFKLGFLLEFISLPVLDGFISAVAATIILNQLPSFLGEENVGTGTARQIHDIFNQLPQANGWACLIGFTGIIMLVALEQAGRRWGGKYRAVWLLSVTRAFLTLVLFTGVGYAVNRHRDKALFDIVKVKSSGQEAPRMPRLDLLPSAAGRSIAIFIGAAIEHTAIARAFGRRNSYTTDQSQELCFLGVANFANSFFHSMGVGGAISRTAVNSDCHVKSPLSGLVTMAVVLVCISELEGALYWIPKATLAAIIITAVWPLMASPAVFYRYWKVSLADFVASMVGFWVTFFVSSAIGIASAVGFNLVFVLLRQVFVGVSSLGADSDPDFRSSSRHTAAVTGPEVPEDTRVFAFNESLFFPNALHNTSKILEEVFTHHAPAYNSNSAPETERNWSVVAEKRLARLRRQAGISNTSGLPPISVVLLDFGRVNYIDSTAVTHLRSMQTSLRQYAGRGIEMRFVDMSPGVRDRFRRAQWVVMDADEQGDGAQTEDEDAVRLYRDLARALRATPGRGSTPSKGDSEKKLRAASHFETAEA